MGIANYVRNGRRFGDRKCSLGAKIPKMSLQAYDSCRDSAPPPTTASAYRPPPRRAKLAPRKRSPLQLPPSGSLA